MHKALLLDCDGVLLNWVDGFNTWLGKYHFEEHKRFNFNTTDIKHEEYCISKRYGIPLDIITHYIKLFNQSVYFASLAPLDNAIEAVNHFYDNDWDIFTVSSYSKNPITTMLRLTNLDQFDLSDPGSHFAHDLGESKAETFKYMINKYDKVVFVDDMPYNIEDAIFNGIENAFLFDQPYNRNHDMERATWKDLIKLESNL